MTRRQRRHEVYAEEFRFISSVIGPQAAVYRLADAYGLSIGGDAWPAVQIRYQRRDRCEGGSGMSRRCVTVTGYTDVELDVTVDELIDQVGREELLDALGEDPRAPEFQAPIDAVLSDIDREIIVARDPGVINALTWVRDRITAAVGVPA